VNVSASAGSDYGAASGTLTFAPGESSKVLQIAIIDDAVGEANETFNVLLNNVSGANSGNPTTAAVTIIDNDKPARHKTPRGGLTPTSTRIRKNLNF